MTGRGASPVIYGVRIVSLILVLGVFLGGPRAGWFPPAEEVRAAGPASGPALVTASASGASTDTTSPEVPLILVHGLTSGGASVWGERRTGARGLYGRLTAAGYRPGRTLFAYDYDGAVSADYAILAAVGLDRVVRGVLAASGADEVDLLTFGSGALVARYWVATQAPGGAPLRNLIMIAPPNHGQTQADLIKVFHHADRLIGRVRGPATGLASGEFGHAPGILPDPPAFTTEDNYVDLRARDYAGLYAGYVLSERLLGGAGAGKAATPSRPPRDFEAWMAEDLGDLVDQYIFSAETPAGTRDLGLTTAYYEILSLRVGQRLYLAEAVTSTPLPPLPSLGMVISQGWKGALVGYLKQVLLDWGLDKARELWNRERAGLAADLGEILSGFSSGSPLLARLVPEHLSFPGPGPASRPVLCNWFLRDWRDREVAGRSAATRYVTIAGSCPNIPRLVGLMVGDNDLVVEVASTVLSPQPPDTFVVRRGLLAFHRGLAADAAVAASVLEVLLDRSPAVTEAGDRTAAGEFSGTGTAGLWAPVYTLLASGDGEAAASGDLIVTVRVGDPESAGLPGLAAYAWLAAVKTGPDGRPRAGDPAAPVAAVNLTALSAPGDPRPLPVLEGPVTAPAPQPGQALVLGVRLVSSDRDGPSYLTLAGYLGRPTVIPFSYSVERRSAEVIESPVAGRATHDGGSSGPALPEGPVIASPGAGSGYEDDPIADFTGAPGGEPGSEPEWADGSAGEQPAGRAEIVATPDPPPLVSVVRVTKMTTTKRESRVFHVLWEWDFGDGERRQDHDPDHTTVREEHTYVQGGTYTARATSWANDGRLLRELVWTVTPAAGETVDFEAETIVEPVISIAVEGPRKWVTGRPARFEVVTQVSWPPRTRRQVLRAYPGWRFDVVWEKPGVYEVRAAVNVRQSYEFPERRLTVSNTYVAVVTIEVFTPGLTE